MILNILQIKISFLIVIILISCENSNVSTIKYRNIKSISILSDSSFLSNSIPQILSKDGFIYISDNNNDRVLKMNRKLDIVKTFGVSGRGPGEFKGPQGVFIKDDSIYVYDEGGVRFNVYDTEGNYSRCFSLSESKRIGERFLVLDSVLYVNTPFETSPLAAYDLNGKLLFRFGTILPGFNDHERIGRNFRMITEHKNKLLCVSVSEPVIEIYNKEGVLLNNYDLANNKYLVNRLNQINNDYKQSRNSGRVTTCILFNDIIVDNNNIYLQFFEPDPEFTVKAEKLLKFKIVNNKMFFESIIEIDEGNGELNYFRRLTILDDKLIAFNGMTRNLNIFQMKN